MNKRVRATILVVAVFVATIAAIGPVSVNAQPGTIPCIIFTKNGVPISPQICNPDPRVNDIKIDFRRGPRCSIQWTTNGLPNGLPVPCPKGANDIEVFWTITAAGAIITKCVWTKNQVPLTIPCNVPINPPANDFHFRAGRIIAVFWTIDGREVIPGVPVPKGANDVEFHFI